jgi:hypothetical protein
LLEGQAWCSWFIVLKASLNPACSFRWFIVLKALFAGLL